MKKKGIIALALTAASVLPVVSFAVVFPQPVNAPSASAAVNASAIIPFFFMSFSS